MHQDSGLAVSISERFAKDIDIPAILHCDSAHDPELLGGKWVKNDFKHCISSEDMGCLMAEAGGILAGYMVIESFKRSYEIRRIAVDAMLLRCGIGGVLVHSLKMRLSMRGAKSIYVDVPEENLRAQLFFKSMGFRAKPPIIRGNNGSIYRFVFTFADLFGGRC